MIDIHKAKAYYKEYISNYNPDNPKIALKIAHIYRTAENAKKLAENLQLSEEDQELAELIGLLHDIGRFEQIKQYDTFDDRKSVNHGEYGVKVLFEDGLIKSFIEDRSYDEIIYKAVLNHNRNQIEEGLNQRELLHAKIIRDADKLDIFYIQTFEKLDIVYGGAGSILTQEITPIILKQYIEDRKINYADRKNTTDNLLSHLAFIFDIYFKDTLQKIEENQYIEKTLNRFEFKNETLKEQIDIAYKQAKEYINNRLVEG